MELIKEYKGMERKFWDFCHPLALENNLEVYDIEYLKGSTTLRVYIMNPQTQTAVLEDCVKMDHAMTPFMEESWIPEGIILEVSSPGLERNLKTKEHFEWAMNELIEVSLYGAVDEELNKGIDKKIFKLRKIEGVLKDMSANEITVIVEKNSLIIPFTQIKKAKKKLNIDIDIKESV